MIQLRDRPLLTEVYPNIHSFVPNKNSVYIFGSSVEERSDHLEEWQSKTSGVDFVCIKKQESSSFTAVWKTDERIVQLRSAVQLSDFIDQFQNRNIYLDITGLSHHIWAPILKSALFRKVYLSAVYVEPGDYKYSTTPTEGEIFDLSEKIMGIAPIPGFTYLSEFDDENVCLIPLIGFEGTRLAYIIERIDPPGGKILPIVGVPGFQPQYPFHTYHGNQTPLLQTQSWKNIRFAIANCPFSLFYTLQDIAKDYPGDLLKIAPIGTKPHALGAIMYSFFRPQSVEIIYDHPIRKPTRTSGTSKLLVYHLSKLQLV